MGCIENIIYANPCGGCLKLRIATAVLAGFEIVYSVSVMILLALSMSTMSMYKTVDALRASGMTSFLDFWNLEKGNEDLGEIRKRLWQIFGVMFALAFVNFVVASTLLYAARLRRVGLVRGVILFKVGEIAIYVIYLLTILFLGQATLFGALSDLIMIAVLVYFLWIVYAFMLELVEEQILKMSPSIIQTQGKIEVNFPL